MQWQKCNVRPAGRVGICSTRKGGFFCALRDIDGTLRMKIGTQELTQPWQAVRESNRWLANQSFGILAGLNRRDGRVSLLSRGTKGKILYAWVDTQQLPESIAWQETDRLAGEGVVLCERCQGGLEAFCTDEAGQVWHMWTNRENKWSDWQCLGGPVQDRFTVVNNEEGFPQLLCLDPSGQLMTRRHHNDGMWGDWRMLGIGGLRDLAAGQLPGGAVCVTALRLDGTAAMCVQCSSLDAWGGWQELDMPPADSITAAQTPDGLRFCARTLQDALTLLRWEPERAALAAAPGGASGLACFYPAGRCMAGRSYDGFLMREELNAE